LSIVFAELHGAIKPKGAFRASSEIGIGLFCF